MRIVIAAVLGVFLAGVGSFGIVQLVDSSQQDPVTQPLYNYGTR